MEKITINQYTASFDEAMRPQRPRLGSYARAYESADDREWHAFRRLLDRHGLGLTFVRWMPKAKANIYKVVKGSDASAY